MGEIEENQQKIGMAMLRVGESVDEAMEAHARIPTNLTELDALLGKLITDIQDLTTEANQIVNQCGSRVASGYTVAQSHLHNGIEGLANAPPSAAGFRLTEQAKDYGEAITQRARGSAELIGFVSVNAAADQVKAAIEERRTQAKGHAILTNLTTQTAETLAADAKTTGERFLNRRT